MTSSFDYRIHETPIGELLLAATADGVVRVGLPGEDHERTLDELAGRLGTARHAPEQLAAAAGQLGEYFAGARHEFTLALDWQLSSGFRRRVLEATVRIPHGQTRSYAAVAAAAGNARAVRATGSALGANPLPLLVPCHRVLRSDGALGGFRGGPALKQALLDRERGRLTTAA